MTQWPSVLAIRFRAGCRFLDPLCKRSASRLARLDVVSGLELCVLGAIDVRRDGEVMRIGGPKPRLLLALLLAHRRSVVSIDRCCEELWGNAQPADPSGVLQSHISRLRRLLRPEVQIVARPPGYVLEVSDD